MLTVAFCSLVFRTVVKIPSHQRMIQADTDSHVSLKACGDEPRESLDSRFYQVGRKFRKPETVFLRANLDPAPVQDAPRTQRMLVSLDEDLLPKLNRTP